MKKLVFSLAMSALLACPVVADETFSLGSFTLAGGESVTGTFFKQPDPDNPRIGGLGVSFDYFDDDGSWASDLRLILVGPGGQTVINAGGLVGVVTPWSFQGSQSDAPGFYEDKFLFEPNAGPKAGEYTWILTNDWASDPGPNNQWNNVTITIQNVPEPASAGLLALGGVVMMVRRRR